MGACCSGSPWRHCRRTADRLRTAGDTRSERQEIRSNVVGAKVHFHGGYSAKIELHNGYSAKVRCLSSYIAKVRSDGGYGSKVQCHCGRAAAADKPGGRIFKAATCRRMPAILDGARTRRQ